MKRLFVTCGLALALIGGTAATASADDLSVGVHIGDHDRDYHRHHRHYHHRRHYWWHGAWYTYQPRGYVYVAPPHPWGDPWWRRHHCWWSRYRHRTVCR